MSIQEASAIQVAIPVVHSAEARATIGLVVSMAIAIVQISPAVDLLRVCLSEATRSSLHAPFYRILGLALGITNVCQIIAIQRLFHIIWILRT